MRRTSVEDVRCSIAQTVEVIGDWWSILILRDIFLGVRRFDAIQSRLGIGRNVLAQRLDWLVDHGVLERRRYEERPPRSEYVLTERGRDLWQVLEAMREWGAAAFAPDGPPVEVVHRGCGRRMHVVPTCSECGDVLGSRDVRAVPGPTADPEHPLVVG